MGKFDDKASKSTDTNEDMNRSEAGQKQPPRSPSQRQDRPQDQNRSQGQDRLRDHDKSVAPEDKNKLRDAAEKAKNKLR
ncbi:MAG: hypothetical protein ABIQ26_23645 [Streptosporangiaceae bacterium]